MNPILCGNNITKSFDTGEEGRNVLDHVSLEIMDGEFVSIMGPSGSGKSTLLFALSGLNQIDSGSVSFDGQMLAGLSDDALSDLRRNKMGFVFQQPTLLKTLNLLDNILLPQLRSRKSNTKELARKAAQLMEQVGIGGLGQREIAKVSGGQLQRAGICRALMNDPRIIFGDEPTGALNTKTAREIMDLFSQINRNGTSILLVTHDANVAVRTNRVLFMQDGAIVKTLKLSEYKPSEHEKRVEKIGVRMRELGI